MVLGRELRTGGKDDFGVGGGGEGRGLKEEV